MESQKQDKPKAADNPVKYDYWTLKDREFFKGTEKPDSAPKLLTPQSPELQG
jgi:hypothetical protein